MTQKCMALLGRRDKPTDALEEYCRYLAESLASHGFAMRIARVSWDEQGWFKALSNLKNEARDWRGSWVLLQYTALSWSRRGFPSRFLRVIKLLQQAGTHVAVVYHDVEPFGGRRIIDGVRRRSQLRTMRAAQRGNLAIFTVPTRVISWQPDSCCRHTFIPVGANFPEPMTAVGKESVSSEHVLTIAVFGVTGGAGGQGEMRAIAQAVRDAAHELGSLRLVVLGRNSETAEKDLLEALRDVPVELRVLGVLAPEDVAQTLTQAHVLLFVRGGISTRRGSAIAGIACGLPVVAFAGPETAPPITEAGLALYSREKTGDLSRELIKVLSDSEYRGSLATRSRAAQREYFSWSAIAARYAEVLGEGAGHGL
jgi:glycosyltransferase involved in cell wall biosynthesis